MKSEDKLLIRVLNGETPSIPPVWLMRQAGRYLPEYRELRAKSSSFLDFCYRPEMAVEATLQPIRRYGFDASIMFSDILVVPDALGQKVWFVEGEGPRLEPLSHDIPIPEFDAEPFHAHLAPVYEVIATLRAKLPAQTTLIGFAGAPWTLATYMLAGRGKEEQAAARRFSSLIDVLSVAISSYLIRQAEAGAEALQIFDSWAGALPPNAREAYCYAPTRKIVDTVRAAHPNVPILGFPRAVGAAYQEFVEQTGVDGVSLDQSVSPEWAAHAIPSRCALQGNLDPMHMITGGRAMEADVERILEAWQGRPHIFNLGHGITPKSDPENVTRLLAKIRGAT